MLSIVVMMHASCCMLYNSVLHSERYSVLAENTDDVQPRRNRLATLAENIRSWEEDVSHPQIK